MARFPAPANVVTDFNDLKIGDVVYEVYGIWPPQTGGPKTVMSTPVKFSEHREYRDIHESLANSVVFDLAYPDGLTVMEFASDNNLVPGYSHNDNYLVRSDEDAKAAALWLREQWSASPSSIAEEQARMFDLIGFDADWGDADYDYDDREVA